MHSSLRYSQISPRKRNAALIATASQDGVQGIVIDLGFGFLIQDQTQVYGILRLISV